MDGIKLDENGIPVLEQPLDTATPEPAAQEKAADLRDEARIEALLQNESVARLLDDLTEDLHKLVSWKIENFLKEEINRLVHEATEQGAARLSEDIRVQLELALPQLLAEVATQADKG
ncbi:MAG TPA: hypothetical protein ENK05_12015 [Gammaproteobacteria bacterium]|nr:hypothetical protein [Gammaproteobacteria bacterium]